MPRQKGRRCDSAKKQQQLSHKRDRYFKKAVRLVKPLPPYLALKAEAADYYKVTVLGLGQILAYARHQYTNYDALRRRANTCNLVKTELCSVYRAQARALIYESLYGKNALEVGAIAHVSSSRNTSPNDNGDLQNSVAHVASD